VRNNIAVIGLSSFGYFLCKYLSEAGAQVLAIDNNEEKIDQVKSFVKRAIVANAKEKETLINLHLDDFDAVVISVGEEIDSSILITLYLRELGVKEIIAKATTLDHAKVLKIIGATSVIFPERDEAKRVSHTLRRTSLLDYVSLGGDFSVIEMAPPQVWIGKTLSEIDIRKKYDVQIIMIREVVPENNIILPSGDHVLKDSDILVILGHNEDISRVERL
jgi:trk system potassium uptake protein TrkA